MNHNIVSLISDKTKVLCDRELITLMGDVVSLLEKRSANRPYHTHYNNIMEYLISKPFDKELFTYLFNALVEHDRMEVKLKDIGKLVYYRELCELYFIFTFEEKISITDVEGIVEYVEEVKFPIFKELDILRVLFDVPDDYDNMTVLSLLCNALSQNINGSILSYLLWGRTSITNKVIEDKIKMLCKKVGKKITFSRF